MGEVYTLWTSPCLMPFLHLLFKMNKIRVLSYLSEEYSYKQVNREFFLVCSCKMLLCIDHKPGTNKHIL